MDDEAGGSEFQRVYVKNSGSGNTGWRTLLGSARGNTASRPTLGAADIGVMYMDTTLDADGKPIWWTGTTWIDATGAAA